MIASFVPPCPIGWRKPRSCANRRTARIWPKERRELVVAGTAAALWLIVALLAFRLLGVF